MGSTLYVVFMLGNEEYGIDISCAQEIIRIPNSMTQLPNMPPYVEGVINLRGKVIPVIDLKKRFAFSDNNRGSDSRLLIIDLEDSLLALIVDDVTEIIPIDDDSMEKPNDVMSKIGNNSLSGIGIFNQRLILLLNTLRLKDEVFEIHLKMEGKV